MEVLLDNKARKSLKHSSFRIRKLHGSRKHEELRKLKISVQDELAAKEIIGKYSCCFA